MLFAETSLINDWLIASGILTMVLAFGAISEDRQKRQHAKMLNENYSGNLAGSLLMALLSGIFVPVFIFLLFKGLVLAKFIAVILLFVMCAAVVPIISWEVTHKLHSSLRIVITTVAGLVALPFAFMVWLVVVELIGWLQRVGEYFPWLGR